MQEQGTVAFFTLKWFLNSFECNYRVTALIKSHTQSVFALQGPRHTHASCAENIIARRGARQVTKLMQIRGPKICIQRREIYRALGSFLSDAFLSPLCTKIFGRTACMHTRSQSLVGIVFYFREIYVTSTNRCFSLARWNKVLSRYISPQLKLHCVVCCCCCCCRRRAAVIIYTRGVWRWRKCSALLLTIILRLDIFHMHHHTPPPP
jgi:hypothetical protein